MKYAPLVSMLILVNCWCFTSCQHSKKIEHNQSKIVEPDFKQIPINWVGLWEKRVSKRDLMKSVIRQFEVENQHLKVNFKFKEELDREFNGYKYVIEDSLVSMIKSGNYAWDIFPVTRNTYKSVAKKLNDPEWGDKYLVNFDQYEWYHQSHIDHVFHVSSIRDGYGGIYAGPLISGRNYALWYNEETAKKLGLEIKQTGMTFDDFLGYCKTVYEYNQTATEKIIFMPDYKLNQQVKDIFNNLVLSELGSYNKQVPNLTKVEKAIQKSLKALEMLSAYNPVNTDVVIDKDFQHILNGQVLFEEKPSSWFNQCETEDAGKSVHLIPAELPIFEQSPFLYPGTYQSVWAVFKNAPHKDQAVELMRYFSTNDVAERWLSLTYNPTGLKVKLKSSDFGQNQIEIFNTYIDKKYGENLRMYDLGEVLYGDKKIVIEPQSVFKGEISAEKFYKKIKK